MRSSKQLNSKKEFHEHGTTPEISKLDKHANHKEQRVRNASPRSRSISTVTFSNTRNSRCLFICVLLFFIPSALFVIGVLFRVLVRPSNPIPRIQTSSDADPVPMIFRQQSEIGKLNNNGHKIPVYPLVVSEHRGIDVGNVFAMGDNWSIQHIEIFISRFPEIGES